MSIEGSQAGGDANSVSSLMLAAASEFPDHEAVATDRVRLSYSDFVSAVAGLGHKLRLAGLESRRVAVVMPNGCAIVVALYAIWQIGAEVVPLNPDYTERELREILADADVQFVICGAAQFGRLESLFAAGSPNRLLVLNDEDVPLLREESASCTTLPSADSAAILQYTGGTTGRPKGVMLTHRTVVANVVQRDLRIPMVRGAERILCVTPLFHAYATAMAMFPALSSGGTLVILPRFKPEFVFDAIERERITLFAGAPAIYNALVSHPEFASRNLRSLRASFSGSAPLAVETLVRWESVSGSPIVEGYGLTESSPILTFNPRHGVRKAGSVGPAVHDTVIEVVDASDGKTTLPTGAIGEVRARGPQLMVGYRNRPDETADAIRDGWLYTGDLGELDRDGYLFIRGRKKDMVIVGGYNVYPREIEEVLFALPGVKDCGVVGVPDSYRGEALHAFVVCAGAVPLDHEAVTLHCARNLARYKVPARISFVDSLPRTSVGKLDRQALRAVAGGLVSGGTAA